MSDKWHSYIRIYEWLFAEYRDKPVALLEFGIQNGGSLEIYAKYFSNPEIIVGCDIDPKCRLLRYPPGTRVVIGDCTDDDTRRRIADVSPSFDFVIDDGSHVCGDVIEAFLKYFPLVRPGGAYVIEDLHTSYWEQWGGGLFRRKSSIGFLKLLVDAIHAEHWGVRETVADLIAVDFPEYRALLDERALKEIKSVHFENSICVVRKTDAGEANSLGWHAVRGADAIVEPTVKDLDGAGPMRADEQRNPWSSFANRRSEGRGVGVAEDSRGAAGRRLTIAAVMPVYNGGRFLRESIQTVLDQTRFPDEFIIIDDASTDDSRAIIEEMCNKFPITFVRNGKNLGQSASRNLAIRQCKSDLIALIDQDDRWYQNHLEELVKPFLEHRRGLPLGWTYSDFDDIDEGGLIVARFFINRPVLQNPKRDLLQFLAQGAVTQPSATLINRAAFEAVGGFDENLSGYEDEDLFLRLFRANYDNAYIPHPLSQWRIYDSSSGASDRMAESQRYYFRKLVALFPDDKWRGHYYVRDVIAPRFIALWALMYLRAGRYKKYDKMRQYAQDMRIAIPHLGLRRRFKMWLAFPILLFPRAGELLIKAVRRYRLSF